MANRFARRAGVSNGASRAWTNAGRKRKRSLTRSNWKAPKRITHTRAWRINNGWRSVRWIERTQALAKIYAYQDRGFDARNARLKLDIESFGILTCHHRFWCDNA